MAQFQLREYVKTENGLTECDSHLIIIWPYNMQFAFIHSFFFPIVVAKFLFSSKIAVIEVKTKAESIFKIFFSFIEV